MSKQVTTRANSLLIALSVALLPLSLSGDLFAQDLMAGSDLDRHLVSVRDLFTDIDSKAESCVGDGSAENCESFIYSLDIEFIGTYLDHCRQITDWVDQVVASAMSDADDSNENEATARRLIEAEFACGKDALNKRTTFVVEAFRKWQTLNSGNTLTASSSNQTFQSRTGSVTNALRLQQSRINQEVDQQWRRLELENLRQQLRRPIDYGDFNFPW